MTPTSQDSIPLPPERLSRVIGAHGEAGSVGNPSPPLLVCVAGIHGNERAGIVAARRVLDALEGSRPRFRGRFVALAGNLGALEEDRRYRHRDLNRAWTPERIRELSGRVPGDLERGEDREMCDLLAAITRELEGRRGPVFFLDLHTNSAGGAPFVCIGDTLRNRAFAERLGLPVVLGLEEQIDGALLEYMNSLGHITAGVEAGGHREPSSVDHHEAVLWLALAAAGLLEEREAPEMAAIRERLWRVTANIPRIVEVRSHHRVSRDDNFRMEAGFRNFDSVARNSVVARDRDGEIRVRESCRLLLPLYQAQGSDGFFTVRRVSRFWLALSALLRRAGLPALMRWLPGVTPHPHRADTLVVDTRLARFLPLQIFHLMGFRKKRWQGNLLLVSRRHDMDPAASPPAG